MKPALRFLGPAAVFAALVGFFIVGLQRDPSEIRSPLIGKPAPAFALESLSDPSLRVGSADFPGQPWLLNVWATWCGGCREEHETLLQIAREDRVPMMGLNWRDDRALALQWLTELGNPYVSVAFDPVGRTAIDWGVYGAPETFLVGADGKVLRKRIGVMTPEIWRSEFLPLLPATGKGS
ncbi:MAG: DsbE family thiol:disulfide interchange protein [Steroidobacteraceae bacterium]